MPQPDHQPPKFLTPALFGAAAGLALAAALIVGRYAEREAAGKTLNPAQATPKTTSVKDPPPRPAHRWLVWLAAACAVFLASCAHVALEGLMETAGIKAFAEGTLAAIANTWTALSQHPALAFPIIAVTGAIAGGCLVLSVVSEQLKYGKG